MSGGSQRLPAQLQAALVAAPACPRLPVCLPAYLPTCLRLAVVRVADGWCCACGTLDAKNVILGIQYGHPVWANSAPLCVPLSLPLPLLLQGRGGQRWWRGG